MKKVTLLILLLINLSVFSQVKIGNNPSQINANSLLELESSNKVFVLNKMTTSNMNAIQPLDGAMVFNTDDKCIFIYEGSSWKSLCNSGTDNQNLTFNNTSNILTLENGGTVDLSSYVNNDTNELLTSATLTGTDLNLTDAGGTTTIDLSSLNNSGTDNQNLTSATITGNVLTIAIENGNPVTVDLSAYLDNTDNQNLTSASITGNVLTIAIENGNPVTVDLSAYLDNTDNQNLTSATITGNVLTIAIENGNPVTVDLSSYLDNTDAQTIGLTGNTLTLANGTGSDTTADLSSYLDNTDAQDISTDGTSGNISIANGSTISLNVNDSDSDSTNELQSLTQSGTNVTLSNGGGTISVVDNDNNSSNELQTLSISGNDITLSNGGGTVTVPSSVITNLNQNTTNGVITYTNENSTNQTANVVSTNANNSISVGTDGGAFYKSPIKAIGKIAGNGNILKATSGITITRISKGRYRVNLPSGMVSDANYIIQLSQPGRGGAGADDPGISYNNQTTTSFEIIVGDNDNGGSDRTRFDSEFMFTILDL
ncbi:hypothetical protein [Lutibacter sp.]|uniref:beta strand repeat-containing protein n=1 Tax=Lutibacter sp. TaxID=1925666 RepID=UPI0025BC7EEE|nr:hypothetical protein [Lutibacter sp.]MCF6181002.1 hypothetical protein [Lutibacter sp.]